MSYRKDKRIRIPLSRDPAATIDRSLSLPPVGTAPAHRQDALFSESFVKLTDPRIVKKPLPKIGELSGDNLNEKAPVPNADNRTSRAGSVDNRSGAKAPPPAKVTAKSIYPTKRPATFSPKTVYSQAAILKNYRKALEPRLISPYISQPNTTPRLIEIERRKRIYLSFNLPDLLQADITALFIKLGLPLGDKPITFAKILGQDPTDIELLLPLAVFDDTDFDSRTVDDWLDVNVVAETKEGAEALSSQIMPINRGISVPHYPDVRFAVTPLPARAFDHLIWRDAVAVAYDFKNCLWKVKWKAYDALQNSDADQVFDDIMRAAHNPMEIVEGKEEWLPRTHVMFLAEDPRVFSKRIVSAYEKRHNAVIALVTSSNLQKHSVFIDCMPFSEEKKLDAGVIESIMQRATSNDRRFKAIIGSVNYLRLIDEYQSEYVRTLNRMVFDTEVSTSDSNQYPGVQIPLPAAEARVPRSFQLNLVSPKPRFRNTI